MSNALLAGVMQGDNERHSLYRRSADDLAQLLLGVGVGRTGGAVRPMLLADASVFGDLGESSLELGNSPLAALGASYPVPPETFVRFVPPPVPQWSPGGALRGQIIGTSGAWVLHEQFGRCITTAGHILRDVNTARCACGKEARVVAREIPKDNRAASAACDMALLKPSDNDVCGRVGYTNAEPDVESRVTIHTSRGEFHTGLSGLWYWARCPGLGVWRDVYCTDEGITLPGDSGALVTCDPSGAAIGHVVGASGTTLSYVQDIRYQLDVFGAMLAVEPP